MIENKYRVNIRRGLAEVRDSANQLDGNIYIFVEGWPIEASEGDPKIYDGEKAMLPKDEKYPIDAPAWISSGDLESV